jgi:hypothetical protein
MVFRAGLLDAGSIATGLALFAFEEAHERPQHLFRHIRHIAVEIVPQASADAL